MKRFHLVFLIPEFLFLFSCNDPQKTKIETEAANQSSEGIQNETSKEPAIEVSTFEVKDETGKSQGWGYDLTINGAKIHQPTIPAISGNHSFATQEDALKTGNFAAEKMKTSGSLPTLSIHELDSLGVIPKSN
jgi:hypothetical protein